MKAQDRRRQIVHLASSNGLASVDELAQQFDVTASTIRRDLALLTRDGKLARTYGGAIALPTHREIPLSERQSESFEAKAAIGKWAATQIRTGDTVLLDAGTTTAALARQLCAMRGITVVTNGLTPLTELTEAADINVICLGGHLRHVSQGFVGPLTEASLETMTFDAVFLGADGVTADRGICEASLTQTRLKELMSKAARHTYVLAHAAKLGRHASDAWVRMPPMWTLVTDHQATDEQITPFTQRGITVVRVDPPLG